MMEKKPKIKKIKNNKPRQKIKASSMMFMGISLVLTISLFIGLVILQNVLAKDIIYKSVIVARKNIPRNTIITEENVTSYFTTKQIDVLTLTDGVIATADELVGQKSLVGLYEGEIVLPKDFERISFYTDGLAEPVEVSIQVDNIANADGGKLRSGDLVNVTMMFTSEQLGIIQEMESNNENGLSGTASGGQLLNISNSESSKFESAIHSYKYDKWAQYVMENLYIKSALDGSGVEIDPTNTETAASMLIFVIDKSTEANLNNALANCSSMRISKVLSKSEDALVSVTEKAKGNQLDKGEIKTIWTTNGLDSKVSAEKTEQCINVK